MSSSLDPREKFKGYSNPEKLVSTQWVADHLTDPSVVLVESDEDVLLYETGHIPGSVKVDWHTDLNHPLVRDYLESLMLSPGSYPKRALGQIKPWSSTVTTSTGGPPMPSGYFTCLATRIPG